MQARGRERRGRTKKLSTMLVEQLSQGVISRHHPTTPARVRTYLVGRLHETIRCIDQSVLRKPGFSTETGETLPRLVEEPRYYNDNQGRLWLQDGQEFGLSKWDVQMEIRTAGMDPMYQRMLFPPQPKEVFMVGADTPFHQVTKGTCGNVAVHDEDRLRQCRELSSFKPGRDFCTPSTRNEPELKRGLKSDGSARLHDPKSLRGSHSRIASSTFGIASCGATRLGR